MTPPAQAVAAPKRLMTVDEYWDFVNLPENDNKFHELRNGEVVEMSRPTRRHGVVTHNIGLELGLYARKVRRGYVAGNDSGVILAVEPATVVGPDVAYFTDAQRFADVHPKWGEDVPVLAVEVLSPNDKPSEVNEKVEDYLKSGVKLVWVVDYERKNVTTFRPDRRHTVLKETDEITGEDVLPGLRCRIVEFFYLPDDFPASAPPPPSA